MQIVTKYADHHHNNNFIAFKLETNVPDVQQNEQKERLLFKKNTKKKTKNKTPILRQ